MRALGTACISRSSGSAKRCLGFFEGGSLRRVVSQDNRDANETEGFVSSGDGQVSQAIDFVFQTRE